MAWGHNISFDKDAILSREHTFSTPIDVPTEESHLRGVLQVLAKDEHPIVCFVPEALHRRRTVSHAIDAEQFCSQYSSPLSASLLLLGRAVPRALLGGRISYRSHLH